MVGRRCTGASSRPDPTRGTLCRSRPPPAAPRATDRPSSSASSRSLLVLLVAGLAGGTRTALGADASDVPPTLSRAPSPSADPTRRRPRPRPRADRARLDRHLLRPRLRPRRRDVAVRRPRPRPRRPGRGDDPGPLLPRRDAGLDPDRDARSGSASLSTGRRRRSQAAGRLRPPRRRGPSTAWPRRSRPTPSCASSRRRPGSTTTWRIRVTAPDGARPVRRAEADHRSSSGARPARPASSCGRSRPPTTSTAACSGSRPPSTLSVATVVNDAAARDLPARRRPGRDAVEPGRRRPSRPRRSPSRSYAARRLRPGVSYYDVVDTRPRRSTAARRARRRRPTRSSRPSPGVVLRSGSSIANTLYHSTGGGGDREQRERLHLVDRRQGRRRRQLPARLAATGRPTGRRTTRHPRTRPGRPRPYTVAQLSAWFARRCADERRDADARSTCATGVSRAGSSA